MIQASAHTSPAIRCVNLRKQYPGKPPVDAVNGLDLTVHEGECFGLLGPNGAGKTTTIEIIEGLLPATAGDVEVLGQRWGSRDRAIREQIGIALQETRLPERLSVLEILTLFRSFYRQGIDPAAVAAQVGLDEKLDAWSVKLSGGQRQRLAVACALVGDPQLLFLDEPTTGLDPQSRRQLWEIIRRFGELGRTVVLTTHYMDEAERLCDRVAIVDRGKIIACDSPRALIRGLGAEHVIEFSLAETPPDDAQLSTVLGDLPTVLTVRHERDHVALTVGEPHVALPALLERLSARGHRLIDLRTRHASLEDVFLKLAGRSWEEADEGGRP
ncbi:MAG: ABC transporter ATP-binding protein [Pirellulales bacterium]|nr:ABC transporter ATP-binding protein [Pirellulales bacterium]